MNGGIVCHARLRNNDDWGPDHGRKPHPQSWAGGSQKFMRTKSSCGCAPTMDVRSAWHGGLESPFEDCVAVAGQSVGDTHSTRMKFLKNTRLMAGSALLVTCLTLLSI